MSDDLWFSYKQAMDSRGAAQSQSYAASALDRYAPQAAAVPGDSVATPMAPPDQQKALDAVAKAPETAVAAIRGIGQKGIEAALKNAHDVAVAPINVAKDLGEGAVEAPIAIMGGVRDAAQGVLDLGTDLERMFPLGGIGKSHDELMQEYEKNGPPTLPNVTPQDSVSGKFVRGATRFLTGFLLLRNATLATGASGAVAATAGAFGSEFLTAPSNVSRLSDLWKDAGLPKNVLTDYLASDPNDTALESRFKNGLESMGLGVLGDTVFKAASLMKLAHPEAAAVAAAQEIRPAYTVDKLFLPATKAGKATGDAMVIRSKIDRATLESENAMVAPSFTTKAGSIGGDDVYINFARIDTPDDIKVTIGRMADAFAPDIKDAQRGVMTFEDTKALADDMGYSVDDLLSRTRGQPLNAETALAARKLLGASAENLTNLAGKAASATATDADLFNFRRAMAMHSAIQNEVLAARTETARALGSWRIGADAGGEVYAREVSSALDAFGGKETASEIAKRISNLKTAGLATPANIAKIAEAGAWAKTRDAVTEAYLSSMLSSPTTHIVNLVSGFGTTIGQIAERAVAGVIPGGEVDAREWLAMSHALVTSQRRALALGWRAARTGESGVAMGMKPEYRPNAISAGAFNLQNTVWGRTVDMIGSAFQIPMRIMMGADEYVKGMNFDAEIAAQSVRKAGSEGLGSDAFKARVADLRKNPTRDMIAEAQDHALAVTFQNQVGNVGKALLKLRGSMGLLGYTIAPFLKTPTNIFRYAMERTPLAPLVGQWRADIAAGGARATKATARAALGTGITLTTMDLASQGYITGAGPSDPEERAALMRQGWQPYSVKIGDTYYSYNRLDPYGLTVGMAATLAEWMWHAPDDNEEVASKAQEPVAALISAVSQSVLNKTYMQGVSGFVEALQDPDRYAREYLKDTAAGFLPFGGFLGATERMVDPDQRLTAGIWETVQSKIAGLSEGLPLKRDLWGEPVRRNSGIGTVYDVLSPIGVSPGRESVIDKELTRLKFFPAAIPFGDVNFSGVPISMRDYPEVYSEYVRLAGNGLKDPAFEKGAKDRLDALVSGKDPLSPIYRMKTDGPEGGKAQMIQSILRGYRERAQQAILSDPKFSDFKLFWMKQKQVMKNRQQTMSLEGVP